MFSFKNIYSENINSANLAFVTGPTKIGKSWLLRYNLRKFQASQQNPLVFHYDMREQGMQSFDMFLHSFEKMFIETLVRRNAQEMENHHRPLISVDDMLKTVVFRFYDKQLFEQKLAKCIDKATNNYSMTAGFALSKVEDRAQLRALLDAYRNREYKETPLLDSFNKLISIIANSSYEGDTFKAALLVIYDVILRKELERRPPHLYSTSQHRDGIDVLNFLCDLVNHISGYTHKYYDELVQKIDNEGLVLKYRKELKQYEGKINESPLLGDRHPHSLLVIESVQELQSMPACESTLQSGLKVNLG